MYFSTPYNQNSPPKNAAIIVEGRGNFSRNNFHICLSNYCGNKTASPVGISDACLTITPHDKRVHIPGPLGVQSTFSNRDQNIKTNVRALSSADALNCLKAVEAKVYDRTDGLAPGERVGFIAQHVLEASAPEGAAD